MAVVKFDWSTIDTVLLDMDGTLLDLHYDSYFWLSHLPQHYAMLHGLDLEQAKQHLFADYHDVAGSLDWYCFDYWTHKTQIDIRALKQEVEHKIQWRNDVQPFLRALQQQSKQRVLLTNCHPDGLATKCRVTGLDKFLDHCYSTHQFAYPKEAPQLWQALLEHHPFDPRRTLFIDDNENLLDQAQAFGIAHTLGIENPDSQQAAKQFNGHPAINDYQQLTEQLLAE